MGSLPRRGSPRHRKLHACSETETHVARYLSRRVREVSRGIRVPWRMRPRSASHASAW